MVDVKPDEISAILKQQLAGFKTEAQLEEVGTVLQVGDGIARLYGLSNVQAGELIEFETLTIFQTELGTVKKELFNAMKDAMASDRAKHTILPMSKFGLIQITRQRVRPERNIDTLEVDPNGANGEKVEAPIVLINKMTSDLNKLYNKGHKRVTLNTHPFIAAFITKGFPSIRSKWFFEHKKWVKILPRDAYTYLEYHFYDAEGNKLK